MATPAEMTEAQVESALKALWAEVDGMPWVADNWAGFDDAERDVYWLEWPDLLHAFALVAALEANGKLTPEQQACYERLVHRYEEILPIIQQLGLQSIPVPKLHSRR